MKFEKTPLAIGFLFSIIFSSFCWVYIDYRKKPDYDRGLHSFLSQFETLENRYQDIKYKLRKDRLPKTPVALVAIDDDSLRELGRWPWSRQTISELTEKIMAYGASAISFDVIFSEPERENLNADSNFGKLIEKYPDKIILGTFSENEILEGRDYQDYCINEAFLRNQGDQIVKLNATLVIDDETDPFETINWKPLFDQIFQSITQDVTNYNLKKYGKLTIEELPLFQKNALNREITKKTFDYCREWLTEKDFAFSPENTPYFSKIYSEILSSIKQKHSWKKLPKGLHDVLLHTDQEWVLKLNYLISNAAKNSIMNYGEWTPNVPPIQNPATYTASFVADQDFDGQVRRYPLFYRSGNRLGLSFIPSMALQNYLISNSYRAEVKMIQKNNQKIIESFKILNSDDKLVHQLPVDASGRMLINYYGTQQSLPYVSAAEIFSNSDSLNYQQSEFDSILGKRVVRKHKISKEEFFKGRSIIIGATAIGIYDLRTIPLEPNYPGPEIHLTMLSNLLDGVFLSFTKFDSTWSPWILLLAGIILTLIWSQLGAISSLSTLIVFLPGLFYADFLFFTTYNQITLLFLFLIITGLTISFSITFYKYFTEEVKKKQLKSTFSKYVSPAVVDELLKSDENLKLGGRRQRMSVFFSDVRGFTTISEKLAPEELSRVLNLYLTPMTEIIFSNKGTLDKYIGDAIMAFFGAPIADEKHAEQACRAALHSLVKLKEIQSEFAKQNLPFIDVGIGVNTGDMSVGNMGSNIVQNYTVMGDAVNLASRLEGTTKEYGVRIIISETTYQDVKNSFITREIDIVRVKGKLQPVAIYELMVEKSLATDLDIQREQLFNDAYSLYRKKDFSSAKEKFQNYINKFEKDKIGSIYFERCQDYIESPPPNDWDGVHVMKTK